MKKHKSKHILNLEQDRAQKLAEMGAELRRVREERSIALEEIAEKTMIRVSLLRAIEDGKIQKLPEPVYIQGFLLRFADALGLDGVAFAKDFPIASGWRSVSFSWRYLPVPQLRPIHLYLVYIFLIICSVKGLSGVMNTTASSPANGENSPDRAVESVQVNDQGKANQPGKLQQVAATAVSRSAQPASGSTDNSEKPVRVGLILKDQSWVQIIADGKTEFEGTLPEGTQRTWEAKQQLVVRAGNAGGVLVAVNDGQAKQMGEPGAVEEVVVPAQQ